MKNLILTEKEKETLRKQHREEKDKRVCDRIKAVLACSQGHSYSEIARWLLLDDETIRRHIKDYLELKKLKPKNEGRAGYLSEIQIEDLKHHLTEKTYLYVKDICHYVEGKYKVRYSEAGMTKWLHEHGFKYKKPHPVPAKCDEEKQKEFVESYKKLKANLPEDEVILFGDSVHPQHQTRLAYGWIRCGERRGIAMNAKHYRLSFIGAYELSKHKLIYKEVEKVNANEIKAFLGQVRRSYKAMKKVHLIWDNAGYHRSLKIKKYARRLGIELHYLPPYSPNLNPIERLWKFMHEKVTYNRYYEKFKDFSETTRDFFKNMKKYKSSLQKRITDNFYILSKPNFAF